MTLKSFKKKTLHIYAAIFYYYADSEYANTGALGTLCVCTGTEFNMNTKLTIRLFLIKQAP
jgi:hypothetical protein